MIIIPMKRESGVWLLAAALLAGCSGSGVDSGSEVKLLTAAYPFQYVAERVGGGRVSVANLTGLGVEPHDIELTPQQVADLTDADLVLVLHGFQPAVDDAVEQQQIDGERLLDVAEVVRLREAEEQEHEHAVDPHVWLDPLNMVMIADAVAHRLAELDPEGTDVYRANADRLAADLRQLDADYTEGLASCDRRTVVTSHDAYGYLADRYDLELVPIAGIDPAQEPSPAQQAEIADTVRAEGVTTIFTEELVSPAVAESIADETGATIATLNPIESLTEATSEEDYLSIMRVNLTALKDANGCS